MRISRCLAALALVLAAASCNSTPPQDETPPQNATPPTSQAPATPPPATPGEERVYRCPVCGAMADAPIECHGQPMQEVR